MQLIDFSIVETLMGSLPFPCHRCMQLDRIFLTRLQCIADSLRSLEQGITVFKLGNETFSIEKENLDLKENGKLKYSRFTLC